MALLDEIRQAVIDGQAKVVVPKVEQALSEGIAPDKILHEGLISAMAEVGRMFEEGEYFVPEMLIAARAMAAALGLLKPHLVEQGVKPIGKVAIGTVKGDLHDIGKSLVAMMLKARASRSWIWAWTRRRIRQRAQRRRRSSRCRRC